MPDQQALHTALNLITDKNAPVFTIYAEQVTPRLRYTCEFIFNHVLHVNFLITSDVIAWQQSADYKISYSERKAEAGLQIIPSGLLSETGVSETKPEAIVKDSGIYFYRIAVAGKEFSSDVFSAVFYFISRYEEWQPFERDTHGRFEAKASILYPAGFHLQPVVDQWIYELKAALQAAYPAIVFPVIPFKAISTIDVDNLYAYQFKGLLRTIGANLKDVLRFNLKNIVRRMRALSNQKKDPFDIYEEVSAFCLKEKIPLFFFFLFKTGTKYDRTVDPKSPAFNRVFSILKNNQAVAGLHPSYDSAFTDNMLKEEVTRFSARLGEPVQNSRQHFLRFDIRTTPRKLIEQGIKADFTMGFASLPGFRAGTSRPFYYYDFNAEKKEELLFVPFCSMDGAYIVYDEVDPDAAFQSLWNLALEVKKVDGLFVTVFHERTFSDHLYPGFGSLYKKLYLKLKEL